AGRGGRRPRGRGEGNRPRPGGHSIGKGTDMATVDYFLKIDGIEGESSDDKHKGSIDIGSWSWSESQTGTHGFGGGGGAGQGKMQEPQPSANVSKASPRPRLTCARGGHLKKAPLTRRQA